MQVAPAMPPVSTFLLLPHKPHDVGIQGGRSQVSSVSSSRAQRILLFEALVSGSRKEYQVLFY